MVDDAISSAFRSAGQRCSALRLLCLQQDIFGPAVAMLAGAARELRVGDPKALATHVGPVIDAAAKARLDAKIAEYAAQRPHPLRWRRAARTFRCAAYRAARPRGRFEDEIFGPVLHVTSWRGDRFAALIGEIAAAGYGLTAGLQTRIESRIAEFAKLAPAGNLYVNRNMIGAVVGSQPFGGFRPERNGPKAGGPDYLRPFLEKRR